VVSAHRKVIEQGQRPEASKDEPYPFWYPLPRPPHLPASPSRAKPSRSTAATARAARSTYARAASASARAVVQDVRASGVTTLKGIAAALQARGVRTPRGHTTWQPAQVSRLLGARSAG